MNPTNTKTAIITGITGQDGSYLAEFLLGKKYRIIGVCRQPSSMNARGLNHLAKQIEVVEGDLSNISALTDLIERHQPDEVYNLASQSFPGESWQRGVETGEITGMGAQIGRAHV